MFRTALSIFLLGFSLLLTGCGFSNDAVPTGNSAIEGVFMGGQQPIANSTITVWQVGTSGYGAGATKMASTTTDSSGNFSFASNAYTCTSANAPMYLTGQSGNAGAGTNANIMLLAVIGPCTAGRSSYLVLNEVSTAAAAIALAPYITPSLGSSATPQIGATCTSCASGTFNAGLVSAMNNTIPAMIYKATGQTVATHTTNGVTVTTEAAKINSIANTLAACINTSGQTSNTETTTNCGKLFNYTNATGATTRPYNTLQAALMMALYPYKNVSSLYNLATTTAPFTGLTVAPNDWTVAISYTSSSFGLGVNPGTATTIAVDASGSVWFPTNKSTAHGLAYFDPDDQTFHGPYATSLTHPETVVIDNDSNSYVFGNDTSAGIIAGTPVLSPTSTGTKYAVGDGTTVSATGAMFVDYSGDVAFSGVSSGSSYNYVLLQGGTSTKRVTNQAWTSTPMAYMGFAGSGADYGFIGAGGYASNTCYGEYNLGGSPSTSSYSGSANLYTQSGTNCMASGLALYYINNNQWDYLLTMSNSATLCTYRAGNCTAYSIGMNAPTSIAIDSSSQLWIANSGDGSLSTLQLSLSSNNTPNYTAITSSAYKHGTLYGGTASAPYALAIDGSGNVWMSNAGCTTTGCTASSYTLTEVIGVASPVVTPYSAVTQSGAFTSLPTK
ncbi:transthyretin-like family protein [Granulicella cerasi]|uniref:Transthyretin-like family protein n=1 Tax=Granulicella cerasi TaxID=741063 RepID=A0ABW1Z8Y9_9BACT|nr:transthyretin-like family protein [Granulicella cerasi]